VTGSACAPGRRLGHSQQTHFLHYAHVIDAIGGERFGDLDALISDTRARSDVPPMCRKSDSAR
jgi:hypothetical protein